MFYKRIFSTICLASMFTVLYASCKSHDADAGDFITYIADPQKADIQLYWKDDRGQLLKSLGGLKSFTESSKKKLVFAANAGMYRPDYTPQGLFIQKGKVLVPVDTASGNGNFYLKPNGIFYITRSRKAIVCPPDSFRINSDIRYATQSGPMLVISGRIHPVFDSNSTSLHIRNGVGVLPDGRIVFAMSQKEVNFYTFAKHFKDLGCSNALYLDGYVSRTYLPEKGWEQLDGEFGAMIGITE